MLLAWVTILKTEFNDDCSLIQSVTLSDTSEDELLTLSTLHVIQSGQVVVLFTLHNLLSCYYESWSGHGFTHYTMTGSHITRSFTRRNPRWVCWTPNYVILWKHNSNTGNDVIPCARQVIFPSDPSCLCARIKKHNNLSYASYYIISCVTSLWCFRVFIVWCLNKMSRMTCCSSHHWHHVLFLTK